MLPAAKLIKSVILAVHHPVPRCLSYLPLPRPSLLLSPSRLSSLPTVFLPSLLTPGLSLRLAPRFPALSRSVPASPSPPFPLPPCPHRRQGALRGRPGCARRGGRCLPPSIPPSIPPSLPPSIPPSIPPHSPPPPARPAGAALAPLRSRGSRTDGAAAPSHARSAAGGQRAPRTAAGPFLPAGRDRSRTKNSVDTMKWLWDSWFSRKN